MLRDGAATRLRVGLLGTSLDADDWADLARYDRAVVRPRLFWDNHRGQTFFATVGVE